LKAPQYKGQRFDRQRLFVGDLGLRPAQIIQTRRLGIPPGRDKQLPYRFVDGAFARHCTRNPLRRGQIEGRDFQRLPAEEHHSCCRDSTA
jgi:DNA-3-methyladenine glycosylase